MSRSAVVGFSQLARCSPAKDSCKLTVSKFKKGGTRLFTNERFNITRYGNRFWALYDGEALICVCVYKVHSSKC